MTFEWENGRILKKITTSEKAIQMNYDSNGMRTQKSVDGVKTNYYYDSSNNLFALTQGSDTLFFYYDNSGEVMSVSCNGTMYYYIKDLQGDITEIVDKDGKAAAEYSYNAWGNMLNEDNGTLTVGKLNPFRYRGYVYDEETGLYYLQSRYYDPLTGRFLNADIYADTQSGTPLSTNMFAYCENNAINKSDSEGKDAWWIQAPNSVILPIKQVPLYHAGHTSLLIQEKAGYWWYFYWGPSSIQLLFLGTTTLKSINKKITNILNRYNREFGLAIINEDIYTQSIRFKGDFTGSLYYIRRYMNQYSQVYGSKIFKLRVNPDSSAVTKNIGSSSHKYYRNQLRPESMIIRGNKIYDSTKWNCMQVSCTALSYGVVKNVNKQYFQSNILGMGSYVSPKRAYHEVLTFNFGKEVCI